MQSGRQYYKNQNSCIEWSFTLTHFKKNYTGRLRALKNCQRCQTTICALNATSLSDNDKKVFSATVVTHGSIERVTPVFHNVNTEKSGQEIDWHCKN